MESTPNKTGDAYDAIVAECVEYKHENPPCRYCLTQAMGRMELDAAAKAEQRAYARCCEVALELIELQKRYG
jgi:hypothetical protein